MTDKSYDRVLTMIVVTAGVLGVAIASFWFWNITAHELLGAPRAGFRHVLAAVIAFWALGWLFHRASAGWPLRSSRQG